MGEQAELLNTANHELCGPAEHVMDRADEVLGAAYQLIHVLDVPWVEAIDFSNALQASRRTCSKIR